MRVNVTFKKESPSRMKQDLISYLPPYDLKKYKQIKLLRFLRQKVLNTTEKNHYSDSPYKGKQIVKKFQNLFCAGVTEDWISRGCITHHKSPSFGLF